MIDRGGRFEQYVLHKVIEKNTYTTIRYIGDIVLSILPTLQKVLNLFYKAEMFIYVYSGKMELHNLYL